MSAPGLPADTGLTAALRRALRGRVVVLGIGNPWRGDDAVGSRIARALRLRLEATSPAAPHPYLAPPPAPAVTVLDAEEVPEFWAGRVVATRPDVVLLVDAVQLQAEPGAVALLAAPELGRDSLATHRTPLGPLADYLTHESGAEVLLLGIQPGPLEWGETLSPALAATAADLVLLLTNVLGDAALASPGPEAIAC